MMRFVWKLHSLFIGIAKIHDNLAKMKFLFRFVLVIPLLTLPSYLGLASLAQRHWLSLNFCLVVGYAIAMGLIIRRCVTMKDAKCNRLLVKMA